MSANDISTTALRAALEAGAAEDIAETKRLRDTRSPIRLGFWVLVVGLGAFLAWAAFAPLDQGVPASAVVSVESRRSTIQHIQGGVIRKLNVQDGSIVKQGDVLVELDDAITRATYENIRQNYLTQRATESRLAAELANAGSISFHPDVMVDDPVAAQQRAVQTQLFDARRAARDADLAAGQQVVASLEAQIESTSRVLADRRAQQALQTQQLANVRQLAEEGFAPRNQALQLEQAQAEMRASIGNLENERAKLNNGLAESRLRLIARRQDYAKEASNEMAQVRRDVQANEEKLSAAKLELSRMQIRAPASGQVIGLNARNPGGVVQAGQPLMDILPAEGGLILDVRIPPHVINNVAQGNEVEVRFAAFAAQPHLVVTGGVVSLSGDAVTETHGATPVSFYAARVALTPEGMKALKGLVVQPGMTAEVLIKTGERTLLNYLLGPLLNRVSASMTEA
jgi:membrane fusion protein, protease secretion system